jgi:aspartate/glutamate racemase
MIKIALIYTGFTPSLMSIVENSIRNELAQEEILFLTYANPDLIGTTLKNDGVTPHVAKILIKNYIDAVTAGADIVYNVCSTMGDIAETVKPIFKLMQIPFIRIDEDMAIYAVQNFKRIGLIATTATIMKPNRNLFDLALKQSNSNSTVTNIILENAMNISTDEMVERIISTVRPMADSLDVLVLTQASLAPVQESISKALAKPVISSSSFGAKAVASLINENFKSI